MLGWEIDKDLFNYKFPSMNDIVPSTPSRPQEVPMSFRTIIGKDESPGNINTQAFTNSYNENITQMESSLSYICIYVCMYGYVYGFVCD